MLTHFSSSPHDHALFAPARHAYSHSCSVGTRYFLPVRADSQSANAFALAYETEIAGYPAWP